MSKKITSVLLLSLIFQGAAWAKIGPSETKRERLKREALERQQFAPSTVNTILRIDAKPQTLTEKIYENFLKENYVAAERLAADYLRSHSSFKDADDVGYLQALCLFKLNRSNEARVKLKSLADTAHAESVRAASCVSLGDSYVSDRQTDLALLWYKEVLRKFPNSDEASYAQDQIVRLDRERIEEINSGNSLVPFFSVQVGSFSNELNAKALVKKLKNKDFDAYVEPDKVKRLFRVRVGRFTKKEEAVVLAIALKQEGYTTQICP